VDWIFTVPKPATVAIVILMGFAAIVLGVVLGRIINGMVAVPPRLRAIARHDSWPGDLKPVEPRAGMPVDDFAGR
jgi:hypothetical protein